MAHDRLTEHGAQTILEGYRRFQRNFLEITRRARHHFERRDWLVGQQDATRRLDLYRDVLERVVSELGTLLHGELRSNVVWKTMKAHYSEAVAGLGDRELAETFFNSVTRHIFTTVGVDPDIEFVDLDPRRLRYGPGAPIHRRYPIEGSLETLVGTILSHYDFSVPFVDQEGDARLVAAEIERSRRGKAPLDAIELIEPVFYRGSGAYLVGRLRSGRKVSPLILVLLHGKQGLVVDAVLLAASEVSIVFSFTRSHFLVDVARPSEVVAFLNSIMPKKPVAELYIALGYTKHGKTELYRDLLGRLKRSMDRFEYAPGDTGMVMIVFTLRYYNYVFKIIRDEFAYPKTNTRDDVTHAYRLVFRHDRAGRLIEAQEFEHLSFESWRFDPELLEELTTQARGDVSTEGDEVRIRHLYIERRVEPLNLFLRSADEEAANRAVLDYGQAIRDMATTNIFPGDMLLKNFGVTRHGRVTFYDYDELCLVTECEFRDLPTPRGGHEEMAAEPWFYVGERDVFPEEFLHFMGLPAPQRALFVEQHAAILTADFWRGLQARHRAGEVIDVFPYPASKRLRPPPTSTSG